MQLRVPGAVLSIGRACVQQARLVTRSVQLVVEILQPGPLNGRAGQWEHQRREQADCAVDKALGAWRAYQQDQALHQRQQLEQHQQQE